MYLVLFITLAAKRREKFEEIERRRDRKSYKSPIITPIDLQRGRVVRRATYKAIRGRLVAGSTRSCFCVLGKSAVR